nr:MAG TPA: hypothetical protein [Caudoviricetes sp.]
MYYNSLICCTKFLKQNEIFHNVALIIHNLTFFYLDFTDLKTKRALSN